MSCDVGKATKGDMDSNDEDKISEWSLHSGTSHHCLFHRNGGGGSTNAVNNIIAAVQERG